MSSEFVSSSLSINDNVSSSSSSRDTVRTLPLYYEQEEIVPTAPNSNNLSLIVCYVSELFSTFKQNSSSLLNTRSLHNPLTSPNKLISSFIKNTSISIFYDFDDSDNFSDGWYPTYDNKIARYRITENNSDADNVLDETRRQLKLKKKEA
ncbi:hypothetical protein F8M41_015830 [Gigaspora margarita]|uniref:Uncharacterized protein n=1 Tax=Gigaspora margarita TaxID=4874 RepID=A0A8H4AQ64_GIGMA|nr:hypothetical protein F8M41_015830 [Gigaspora margarita]